MLDIEWQQFQRAKTHQFHQLDMPDLTIAKLLKMPRVPVPGPLVFEKLSVDWAKEGIDSLLALCKAYIVDDVEPLLEIVEKFQATFYQEKINPFKDFITLRE